MKMKLLFLIFVAIVSADNLLWTGKQDSFWHNPSNWYPAKVPTINDTVRIENTCPVPPYAVDIIEADSLINNFRIDIYECHVKINNILGNGDINIYKSRVQVANSFILSGKLKLIETSIIVPMIMMEKNSILTGAGRIDGFVNNIEGIVRLEPSHILYIDNYRQSDKASLVIYLGNNSIIGRALYLSGKIYAYCFQLDQYYQVLARSKYLTIHDLKLFPINRNAIGNLTATNDKLVVYLKSI